MKKNKAYWNEIDQKHIELYVFSSNKETKDKYFSLLHPTLVKLIDSVGYKYNFKLTEDNKQEVIIRLYEYVLPKITMDKVQAAYAYLYTSIGNLSRNEVRASNGKFSHDRISKPLSMYDSNSELDDIDSVVENICSKDKYNQFTYEENLDY